MTPLTYRLKTTDADAESGVVIFWVLSLCVAASLVVATITLTVSSDLRLEELRSQQRAVYLMARSEAITILNALKQGHVPAKTYSVLYPTGFVQVSFSQGTLDSIQVTARAGSTVDVLTYQLNPVTFTVTNWVDNASVP